jgi:hypothetical protein
MTKRTRTWLVAVLAVVVAGPLAGCGSTPNYANDPRPPAPIAVSASVNAGRISVSPARIGAGPIRLLVANLGKKSLEVIVDPVDADGTGARSGLINPQSTASLQLTVTQGTYKLKSAQGSVAPGTLSVGKRRKSAQNQLLLP